MASEPIAATPFINIQVIAAPETDPKTGKIKYKTEFIPESIIVSQYDTVINYQLITPTPSGVTIRDITVTPTHSEQLSRTSIGRSGKIATFSDANTVKESMNVTLHFIDSDLNEFSVDPIIDNDPPVPPMNI